MTLSGNRYDFKLIRLSMIVDCTIKLLMAENHLRRWFFVAIIDGEIERVIRDEFNFGRAGKR